MLLFSKNHNHTNISDWGTISSAHVDDSNFWHVHHNHQVLNNERLKKDILAYFLQEFHYFFCTFLCVLRASLEVCYGYCQMDRLHGVQYVCSWGWWNPLYSENSEVYVWTRWVLGDVCSLRSSMVTRKARPRGH